MLSGYYTRKDFVHPDFIGFFYLLAGVFECRHTEERVMETFIPAGNINGPILPRFVLNSGVGIAACVLYALLCDHARNKDHCWPTYRTLAGEMGCSETSIKAYIRELVAANLIALKRKTGRENTIYLLRPKHSQNSGQTKTDSPQSLSDSPQTKSAYAQADSAYRINVRNNQENQISSPTSQGTQDSSRHQGQRQEVGEDIKQSSDFEQFWLAYPKKFGKDQAYSIWRELVASGDMPCLQDILQSLEQLKASHNWRKQNGRFIPFPAKFLHHRRWLQAGPASGAVFTVCGNAVSDGECPPRDAPQMTVDPLLASNMRTAFAVLESRANRRPHAQR